MLVDTPDAGRDRLTASAVAPTASSLVSTLLNTPSSVVPSVDTARMIATEISAARRPYSIAVAPESSCQSDLPKLKNLFTSGTPYTLHYTWSSHGSNIYR